MMGAASTSREFSKARTTSASRADTSDLRGMRDRVAIMNGTLEIDSGADGTSVEVRFPIQ